MTSGIYAIFGPNNKVYIGRSVNIENAWQNRHKRSLRLGCHRCRHLQYAYNKHGKEVFRFVILLEAVGNLRQLEADWIRKYINYGYNLYNSDLPEDGSFGLVGHSLETRKKISEAQKGRTVSLERRKKISETLKGKPLSLETRKKISNVLKGKPHSLEHIKKVSEANKGKHSGKGKPHTMESRTKISEAAHKRSLEKFERQIAEAQARKQTQTT